eukprot:s2143_g13.t1
MSYFVQEAGCEVHAAGKDPFDCEAALSNFFRAWSPSKKHWCCTQRGKGCEGSSPPAVDAGFGMVWKHVQAGRFGSQPLSGLSSPSADTPQHRSRNIFPWLQMIRATLPVGGKVRSKGARPKQQRLQGGRASERCGWTGSVWRGLRSFSTAVAVCRGVVLRA